MTDTLLDPAQASAPPEQADPTLADLKAQRERLQAQRAQAAYERAAADAIPRSDIARIGALLRSLSCEAIEQLTAEWLLDTAGESDETRVHHAMSLAVHRVLSGLSRTHPIHAQGPAQARLLDAFHRGAAPRQVLTVSQWAARHRKLLTGTNSPGDWRNELTPYLTEIMDSLSEHSPARYVTFIKSSGVGGTEALYNWIGYVMHHLGNKDLLVVLPTLELRDRSFNSRFGKLLTETPALARLAATAQRASTNRKDLMEYGAGNRLIKAGANSPDSMRSDHIPYVVCDEVAAFPWDVGGEGDPMTLIDNRQRTFTRAKSYFVSTPTTEGTCRITQLYNRSDQRRYHVPCPHCGELQHLEFGGPATPHGLKWRLAAEDPDAKPVPGQAPQVIAAWYVCQHCGAEIQEAHKPDMLAAGRWIARHPQRKHHRGYHLNALYAPTGLGLGWLKIAQKWLEVQGDTAELKAFVNTYLGEVWRDVGDSVEPGNLLARLEPYEGADCPIKLVTGGVDIQKDRIELSVVGWGAGEEAWLIDHLILPGDTTGADVWNDLRDALQESGVQVAAIDTGFNTSMVHDFCATRTWCVPIKGMSGPGRPLVEDERKRRQRLRARRKRARPTEPLGVDQAKTLIYSRLKLPAPGPGYIHFPQAPAFDDEYFAQLAAERLVTKVRGTRPFQEWVQLRPRNEALDCLVYALAAVRLAAMLTGVVLPRGAVVGGQGADVLAAQDSPAAPDSAAQAPAPSSAAASFQRIQRLRAARRR